jgi:hypothetical protein
MVLVVLERLTEDVIQLDFSRPIERKLRVGFDSGYGIFTNIVIALGRYKLEALDSDLVNWAVQLHRLRRRHDDSRVFNEVMILTLSLKDVVESTEKL